MTKTDMARLHFGDIPRDVPRDIPRQNPCAQCGTPIPRPDWIEPGEGRVSYLWTCHACNYRFEAVAIFDQDIIAHPPLAA